MKPMKLTDVGLESIERYLTDPNWVMQQKMDGARMLTVVTRVGEDAYQVLFTNDGVTPIAFSAAKLRLPALLAELTARLEEVGVDEITLDGELIIDSGIYHVFDLLRLRMSNGAFPIDPSEPWATRHLRMHFLPLEGELIRFSPTAATEGQKREMWASVVASGVEGAVSKHIDSSYVPGTRTTQWVKHKLVKTADVIVASLDRTFKEGTSIVSHGSAALVVKIDPREDPEPWAHLKSGRRTDAATWKALTAKKMAEYTFDPRSELPVGNASLIGKDLTIDVGSVVEIEYLYFTGRAVIQPRITRKREDKRPFDCRLDQFPAYTRQVAWQR